MLYNSHKDRVRLNVFMALAQCSSRSFCIKGPLNVVVDLIADLWLKLRITIVVNYYC